MFVTRKSLSRRTVLKGMGTTLALPFLESMVPAFQALAQSPAKPPMRFGAIYFPNGALFTIPNTSVEKRLPLCAASRTMPRTTGMS